MSDNIQDLNIQSTWIRTGIIEETRMKEFKFVIYLEDLKDAIDKVQKFYDTFSRAFHFLGIEVEIVNITKHE